MRAARRPAHLLVRAHPSVQQTLHRALGRRRRDRPECLRAVAWSMIMRAWPTTTAENTLLSISARDPLKHDLEERCWCVFTART